MSKVCANCGNILGPFSFIQLFYDPPVYVCKNTKSAPTRITECVERREKIDYSNYKEQVHPYA